MVKGLKLKQKTKSTKDTLKEDPPFSEKIYLFFAVLISILVFLYWKPITSGTTLNFDDQVILTPLYNVHSFSDYIELVKDNTIFDLQPIRDLSYILEIKLARFFQITLHPQAVNLFLWIFSLFILYKIFILEEIPKQISILSLSLISLHPVAVNSIAWASGRKHVLTMLFILAATYCLLQWLKNRKRYSLFLSILFYTLSCLAQPINLGWILWVFYLFKKREKLDRWTSTTNYFIFILFLIGFIIGIANIYYYASERYLDHLGEKFIYEGWDFLGNRILIFGRFFIQLVLPIQPSITSYDPTSPLALIGFILLLSFLYLFYKFKNENLFIWGLFTIIPTIVSNGPSNQHFGWDTYLLTPLAGSGLMLGIFLKIYKLNSSKIYFTFLPILFLYSIQTKITADAWLNDETLWNYSLKHERTQSSYSGYLKTNLSLRKNISDLWPILNEFKNKYPKHPDIPYIYGRMILEDKQIDIVKKRELFQRENSDNPWFIYYYSAFDASQKNFIDAEKRLLNLFQVNRKNAILNFKDKNTEVLAALYAMCRFGDGKDCKSKIESIQSNIPSRKFSEKDFRDRLSTFHLTYE